MAGSTKHDSAWRILTFKNAFFNSVLAYSRALGLAYDDTLFTLHRKRCNLNSFQGILKNLHIVLNKSMVDNLELRWGLGSTH